MDTAYSPKYIEKISAQNKSWNRNTSCGPYNNTVGIIIVRTY